MRNLLKDKKLSIHLPKWISLPGGEFFMGYDRGRDDERPVHLVSVDPFDMGIYTITNREYLSFLNQTNELFPPSIQDPIFSHPNQPVVSVSWENAMSYCRWLSALTERIYRLPTEAEWEWASRQMKKEKLYPWGDQDPLKIRLYNEGWQDRRPQIVGQQPANSFGLFNVGDNVHEWCADWYESNYYKISPKNNPVNHTPTGRKASRGGSWRHQIKVSRCAARSSLDPSFMYSDYGFRIVKQII